MEKTAFIIAVDEKGLQPVFTIPSVRRLILLMHQAGITDVHVLGRVNPLMPILADLVHLENFHVIEKPAELFRVFDALNFGDGQRVLVSKAHVIVDQFSLARLLSADDRVHRFFMKADGQRAAEGIYLSDAKDLLPILRILWPETTTDPNFETKGFRIEDPAVLPWRDRESFSERNSVLFLTRSHPPQQATGDALAIPVQGIAGLPTLLDESRDAVVRSEDRLVAALSVQTHGSDGFFARHVDRRISRFFSKRLSRTRITPNRITLCGVTIGLFGAFLLCLPDYWIQLSGAFLFLFCVIVDGVDGEVARLKLQASRFGHYLDIISDNLVHIAVFSGIALGLYRSEGHTGYLYALGFLMGGFGVCAVAVYDCILRQRQDMMRRSSKTLRLMTLMSNRDFAYLIVVLAAIHRLDWFLIGAAIGTYLFAAALWILRFYENLKVNQSDV